MSQSQHTTQGEMRVEGLVKRYGLPPYTNTVIKDCSFVLPDGQFTVLIGPSGCGKSTLINLMAGYEKADEGTITLNGTTTGGVNKGDWIELEDIASGVWGVAGTITGSGTEATPFSAAV